MAEKQVKPGHDHVGTDPWWPCNSLHLEDTQMGCAHVEHKVLNSSDVNLEISNRGWQAVDISHFRVRVEKSGRQIQVYPVKITLCINSLP